MRISLGGQRSLQLRNRIATDVEEGGEYLIQEIANVLTHDDKNYVTSAGVAFRNDHTPTAVRIAVNRAAEESKKSSSDN